MNYKVQYKSLDGRFTTQLESELDTGIIEALFNFQNLFEKNTTCGLCGSPALFNIRKTKKGRYFERKCNDPKCGASFPYHAYKPEVKNGGLYFKWDDRWSKYNYKQEDEDQEDEVVEEKKSTTKKGSK